MENIHFIVNSLSPSAQKIHSEIDSFFNTSNICPIIKLSKYKGHTIALTTAAIEQGAKIIVACGGDGTVNEVAQCLVHTTIKMGILPIGSGNGLARHLQIPTKLQLALKIIANGMHKSMDVGKANNHYFFCNVSVAFSAQVISCYDQIPQRGFIAYARAFLKAVRTFKYVSYHLEEKTNTKQSTPFVLMLSNTDQLGYNKTLTPNASLFDGKLDLVQIEKSNALALSAFMLFAFFKRYPTFIKITRLQLQELRLLSNATIRMQLDGEIITLNSNVLNVKVLPKALHVIC